MSMTKNKPIYLAALPVSMRAKHAKRPDWREPWLKAGHKLAVGSTCVLLSGALIAPNAAFAADWIEVDGSHYDTVGAAGKGWAWVAQDDLQLNGYNGGAIAAQGDLNIVVENENTVTSTTEPVFGVGDGERGISVINGDLTIEGDGSLDVTSQYDGIAVTNGSLTIDGATVRATGSPTEDSSGTDGAGIAVYGGNVNIVNGADVTALGTGYEGDAYGVYVSGYGENTGKITIENSTLVARGNAAPINVALSDDFGGELYDHSFGMYAYGYNTGIFIKNSNVTAEGQAAGIFSVGTKSSEIQIVDCTVNGSSDVFIRPVDDWWFKHDAEVALTVGKPCDPSLIDDPIESLLESDEVERKVVIKANNLPGKPDPVTPSTSQDESLSLVKTAYASTGDASSLAKTNDATAPFGLAALTGAAAALAAGAVAFVRRRVKE